MKKTLLITASLFILTGCSEDGLMNKYLTKIKGKATSLIEKYKSDITSINESDSKQEIRTNKITEDTLNPTYEETGSIIIEELPETNETICFETDSVNETPAVEDSYTATGYSEVTVEMLNDNNAVVDDRYNNKVTDSLLMRIRELEEGLAAADAIIAEKEAAEAKKTEKKYTEYEDESVYDVVEILPEFQGGAEAMNRWIARNISYPEISREHGSQGTVVVRFLVNKDGSIQDARITRSSGDVYLDREATRLISSMPRWTPGRKGGKNVRTWFTIPVRFRLQ